LGYIFKLHFLPNGWVCPYFRVDDMGELLKNSKSLLVYLFMNRLLTYK